MTHAPPRRLSVALAALALALLPPLPARALTPEAPPALMPETIGGQPAVEVVSGSQHSCALVANGWVYCWGINFMGQLGDGSLVDSTTPVRVANLTNVVQISAANGSTCALRANGRVFCWGRNDSGRLGNGNQTTQPLPVQVQNLTGVVQVAAGRNHTCALRGNGRVFCWGENLYGQLGDGTATNRFTPVMATGFRIDHGTQLVAGARHTCLLRRNNRVVCWGHNGEAQLGTGTRLLQLEPHVLNLSSVTQIAAGDFHTCALRRSGRVFCWGQGANGQMGNGSTADGLLPVRVNRLTGVTLIGAGGVHNCALRSTGRVFCWGRGTSGQLGDNDTVTRLEPVRITGLLMINAISLGMSTNHTCGVRANGRVYCWGNNSHGQIGDGTTDNRRVPVRVLN